ncbi:hypothetical protein [Fictibacillus norfolkensis]|uniref:Phr family secreted Rap phosphatase inhibitor n=1 Tax=Fictibacillus norfolkensis TaxID=2762233 RepID=A0ABR8SRG4_9BACL|nr:hypothetical protein [Fictibacillus norfolkensis]MBD7965985.1 hypothetical protein [Fictibacillus norfolkensis]
MKKLGLTLSFALALSVVAIGGVSYTIDNGPNPTKHSVVIDNGPNPTMPAKNIAAGSYKMIRMIDNGPNPT